MSVRGPSPDEKMAEYARAGDKLLQETKEAMTSKSETRRLAHQDPGKLAEENVRLREQLALAKAWLKASDDLDEHLSASWVEAERERFRASLGEKT